MKYVRLNNGVPMPMLGLGVYQIPDALEAERVVSDAFEVGYRLIDTAAAYGNEESVGNAIRHSGIDRSELFITTKLWVQDYGYEPTLKAFDASLKKLGLDYLDLYLMHKPYGDYYGSWRALEKLYREGMIRAIGVTSFWNERLADLVAYNEIKPTVNQIETNVWRQQDEAVDFMAKTGVAPQAWAPFAEGLKDVFNAPVLKTLAEKYGKSTAQIMLRWHLQRGVSVIPKTTRKQRLVENMNIFNFNLSDDDMANIKTLDTGKSPIYDEMDPKTVKWIAGHKIHN